MKKTKQKIVTIGGGTGSFTILSGLKNYPVDISAIVSMADDGGSTGVLRDELGVLPPGDVRQCLIALSKSGRTMRELFSYRYAGGGLAGHNFGNIFLSTLEKITGSFEEAIRAAGEILRIRGRVIPVTLSNIKLIAILKDGRKIIGQHKIDETDLTDLKVLRLFPRAKANPEAVKAILSADKIVINPGTLYDSIVVNFLVRGIAAAIRRSRAKKIYVCNLMNKKGQTDGFGVVDYLETLERHIGKGVIGTVIYNKEKPSPGLVKRYAREGDLVRAGNLKSRPDINFLGRDLLARSIPRPVKGDSVRRSLIRHDSDKIAKIIYSL